MARSKHPGWLAVCASGILAVCPASVSQAQQRPQYEIEGGDLGGALQIFAHQSDQQILYSPPIVEGRTTQGFKGNGTATDALTRILANTGLTYTVADTGILLIVEAADPAVGAGPPGSMTEPIFEATALRSAALDEIVVTATRQTSTVNRVPLSISAVTQQALIETGVKNTQDVSRTVPSVTFRRTGNDGAPTIAIRGISSSLGSPTTAIYLDDTPLHKRDNSGFTTGNGTPLPQLFDLARVEVLRGPQGTLYGGSAQGGAIRFITRAPSLTDYSGFAHTEAAYTQGGDPSYELGVAFGGPIRKDILGFRASLWGRRAGGYLDHVSIYDGHTIAADTNSLDSSAARVALAWAPTRNLLISPALYASRDHARNHDVFWEDVPGHATNEGYFTNRSGQGLHPANGVAFDFADRYFAGGAFGPYDYGPGKTGYAFYRDEAGDAQVLKSPRKTTMVLPSLTLEYSFGGIDLKSITSVLSDTTRGSTVQFGIRSQIVMPIATNAGFVTAASHTAPDTGTPVPGGVGTIPLYLPGFPQQYNNFNYDSSRNSFTQEIRLTSVPAAEKKLHWVAGLYFTHATYDARTWSVGNTNEMSLLVRGVPEHWFFGALPTAEGLFTRTLRDITEQEFAAFGELNYALNDRVTLIAGMRVSHNENHLRQVSHGTGIGSSPGFAGSPPPPAVVTDPGSITAFPDPASDAAFTNFSGQQKDRPINPKIGLSWQASERNLFYLTAAKGYRGGGINGPANPINCAADLAALGLTGTGTPLSYESDAVWSYEAGAKVRLLGMQLNASAFFIEWQDPQLAVRLRCAQTYVTNAGRAASSGLDLQLSAQPVVGLTLRAAVAYTDARYTETYALPLPGEAQSIVVAKDDPLGVPEWHAAVGAEYALRLAGLESFVRADFQYSGEYERGVRPGRVGHDPLIFRGDPTRFLSARAGVNFGTWDVALFGNNLTNSQDRLSEAHTVGFALVTSSTFRPREYGLQATFRFD